MSAQWEIQMFHLDLSLLNRLAKARNQVKGTGDDYDIQLQVHELQPRFQLLHHLRAAQFVRYEVDNMSLHSCPKRGKKITAM